MPIEVKTMQINYLSLLRDQLGIAAEEITLLPAITTLAELMDWLASRGDTFQNIFSSRKMIYAMGEGHILSPHDKIADCEKLTFFSPIVGG